MNLERAIKDIFRYAGIDIRRVSPGRLGRDSFLDMRTLTASPVRPVIFDVGANIGQSIELFRRYFTQPVIHSFEPGRDTFQELQRSTAGIPDLHLNPIAIGSRPESKTIIENTNSDMTSLLEPGPDCWGEAREGRVVEVSTVDEYCRSRGVDHIDILKTDTQGYDLEVLRGAQEMMYQSKIHLIHLEIIFSDMYKGLPSLDETYRFLVDHGFALVAFYTFHFQNNRASWTDALFVQPGIQRKYDFCVIL